jgi:hypothetical protein
MNPVCEYCRRAPATVADHGVRIKDGGATLDISNLVSLLLGLSSIQAAA